jgi:hypothetical protein
MTVLGIAFGALGIVLVVSGVLKLADPEPTAAMLRELSPGTRRFPIWMIGIGELSLGLAAVAVGGRVIAVLVAACYATFAAVSIKLVRRGGTVPCGCLGSRSAPASLVHVGVNLGATIVAVLAAVAGIPGVLPGRFTASGVVHVVLACLVAGFLVALLRSGPASPAGSSQAALEDPPSPGPAGSRDFEGTTPDGAAVLVTVTGAEHRTLLAFLGAGCATCARFWRELGTGHAAEFAGHHTELVLVTRGPEQVDPVLLPGRRLLLADPCRRHGPVLGRGARLGSRGGRLPGPATRPGRRGIP